jgi:integrase
LPDISIGRLRGGYCVVWIEPETGKRRRYQLAARSRAEAESEALDIYRAKSVRPTGHTVAEIWADYRRDLGDKPTAKTMLYTGKAVLAHFGHFRPDQITRDMCRAYAEDREEAGISQGSVHTELGHLRSALVYGAKVRMIDRAPDIWRPNKPAGREVFLTRPELVRLIDAAHAPHIRLALTLLAGTAARVGAVLDLEWSRIDFERGTINLRLEDSRTRKGRAIVPMNGMTRAALAAAQEAAISDYVVEVGGRRINSIRTGFDAARERAGLQHVTLHDIRRTAARFMVEAGVPISKVAQLLGHSNESVTYSVYGRFAPDALKDAAEILNFAEVRKLRT